MTTKVSSHMVEADLKTDTFVVHIPDPQGSNTIYPIDISVQSPYTINKIYFTVTSSDNTGTVTFDVLKNGTSLTEFASRIANNTRQFTAGTGIAANTTAVEDYLEVKVTSVGGTDRVIFSLSVEVSYE